MYPIDKYKYVYPLSSLCLYKIMEPLQEIHRDKWPQLLQIFEQDWPLNVVAYCIIDIQLSNPNLSRPFKFRVYAAYGNLELGMIAMTDMVRLYNIGSLCKSMFHVICLGLS